MISALTKLGAEIKGYALNADAPNDLFNQIKACNLCTSVIADIRNKKKLEEEIQAFQPDIIFHLAARALVKQSYENPLETFDVNVIGTTILLESVRALKKKCAVVVITTDKVYENLETNYYYKESDKLGGYDPYSASKACTELVTCSFRNSFFNTQNMASHQKGIATARAGNVIGGGDWSENRILPDIVRALKLNEDILVRNPNAIRPWQHVLEPVFAYLKLGYHLYQNPEKFSTAYNFGPLQSGHCRVEEIVQHAIKYWGKGNYEITGRPDQPHEAGLLKLDIKKAQQELGWNPKYTVEVAIQKTIEWYKEDDNKKLEITYRQIEEFNAN